MEALIFPSGILSQPLHSPGLNRNRTFRHRAASFRLLFLTIQLTPAAPPPPPKGNNKKEKEKERQTHALRTVSDSSFLCEQTVKRKRNPLTKGERLRCRKLNTMLRTERCGPW